MSRLFAIPETEAEFQGRVVDLAEQNGWDWLHIGRVGKYSANGAKGTLRKGWPDLLLVRGRRMLLMELKAQDGVLSTAQREVIRKLSDAIEVYVFRPGQWAIILEVLR